MFNNKRIERLEDELKYMRAINDEWRGKTEARLAAIEDAISETPSFRSFWANAAMASIGDFGKVMVKSGDINARITRLMDHFGLREETIREHTTIVKEKK